MNTNTKTILGWALIIGPILFHIFFGIFYGDTDPTIATSEEFLKQASDNILLSKILVVGGNATMVFVAGALFVFASFLASNSHSPAYGLFSAFFFLILGANVIESGATELTALEFYDQGNINQAVDVFNSTLSESGGMFSLILAAGMISLRSAIIKTEEVIGSGKIFKIVNYGLLAAGLLHLSFPFLTSLGDGFEALGFLGWIGGWLIIVLLGVGILRTRE